MLMMKLKSALIVSSFLSLLPFIFGAGCPDPCFNNSCDDGLYCNGLEVCTVIDNQAVCSDGVPPCEEDEECNEETDICEKPWGKFEVLSTGPNYKIKRLIVNSGKRLSLQKHFKRSENWVVIKGKALMTLGEKEFEITVGEHVFIDFEEIHRVENTSSEDLVIIEVQNGSYLGEDDIERLDDDFER